MRKAVVAAVLSFLVPGAGQLYLGERRRGTILFGAWAGVVVATLALVAIGRVPDLGRTFLALLLLANAAVLALRLFAIVDAARGAFASRRRGRCCSPPSSSPRSFRMSPRRTSPCAGTASSSRCSRTRSRPTCWAAAVSSSRSHHRAAPPLDLDPPALRGRRSTAGAAPAPFRGVAKPLADSAKILADEEEALEHPWVTILLLGSDEGPRQAGDRTDTMIVAAIQRKTHRAVLFGVPRNLVGVDGFGEPLNALYQHRGATGLKHAISRLLGLRVDYHAMVNLDGFVRDGRRARRCSDHGEGTHRRRGDAAGVGGDEAEDRRVPRPHVSVHGTDGARLRAVTQGVERLPPHGSPALLHQRAREPARRRRRPAPLRFAGRCGRVERAHGHPAEPRTRPDAPRGRRRLARRR